MAEDSRGRGTLAIVVVNYNSHQLLRAHLASCQLQRTPARIVVVDNSDAPEHVASTYALCVDYSWDYLPAGGNVGFGAGVNAGVRRAIELGSSEFIILNPDAWMDVDTARALGAMCSAHPSQAISPVIRRPDGRPWFTRGTILMERGRVRTNYKGPFTGVPWLTGAALVISRELWERVGGFDEKYFLYWEDVDLSWRILEAGGQLTVVDDLSAFHLVGATQGGAGKPVARKSPTFVYYNCRNRLLFAGLHLSGSQRVGWLRGTPRLTWEMIGLGGRTPAAFWAGLRGVTAGLPHVLRGKRS